VVQPLRDESGAHRSRNPPDPGINRATSGQAGEITVGVPHPVEEESLSACFFLLAIPFSKNSARRRQNNFTKDRTDNTDVWGSTRGSRVGLKAWPSLRVRCSLARRNNLFLQKETKVTKVF